MSLSSPAEAISTEYAGSPPRIRLASPNTSAAPMTSSGLTGGTATRRTRSGSRPGILLVPACRFVCGRLCLRFAIRKCLKKSLLRQSQPANAQSPRDPSEFGRAHRSKPFADLRGIGLIHIEEVSHHRLNRLSVRVIELHRDDAAKDLEQSAIPIFNHIVVGGESLIDKGAQALANLLASVPFRNAEATLSILREAIETFTESFVIDFFPKR